MPANTITCGDLMTAVRRRADMEGSTFVTDAEIRSYINVAMAELHDILVQKYEDYYISSTTYTLPITDNKGTLPDAFYKMLGVDFTVSGNTYRVRPYKFEERNMYGSASTTAGLANNLTYHVQGNEIHFRPADALPSGTVTIYYVPQASQFSLDGLDDLEALRTNNRAIAPGYEEYIVIDAAIKCLLKEEADVTVHLVQRESARRRIEEAAGKRDAGEPYAISDVNTGTAISDFYTG